MSDSFGAKLGIEGEKEFKNALREINSSFKVLHSEMNLVTSEFDKNDKSQEAVTSRSKVLNKEIEAQKEKIEMLEKALANSTESFGENDKRTKTWATQLNNAKADLNKLNKELDENEESLDDSSEKAEKAGKSFDKLGSICKGAATTIAGVFTGVASAAVSAGKALADMSVSGASYADDVLTTSTQTGIATEKLQEYMYAAELVDVSTETLTKSMAKQIKSMKGVQDGTKLSIEAYKKLGVQVLNADGTMRDSDTVYWEVIDSLGKMTNETERDAYAMQILGKSAQELNPLIEAGSKRMNELGEEAKKAGYIVGEESLNAFGALDDQLQYLDVGAAAAKNALGTVLLPVLTELAGDGVNLLGEFTNGILNANGDIGKMSEVIAGILPDALSSIMKYIPEIIEMVGVVISSLGEALSANMDSIMSSVNSVVSNLFTAIFTGILPSIMPHITTLLLNLVDMIVENLPILIEAALQMVLALADGLAQALPELIPQIVEMVVLIVNTLIDNVPALIDAALQIVVALAEGLGKALPELVAAVPQLLSGIVKAIVASLPLLLPAALDIIFALVEGLLAALPELIAAVPNLIMGIVQGIIDNLPTIILWAPEIITSLITGIIGAIPQLIMAIPKVIMSIVDTFKKYDWGSVGKNLMDGLINGITGMITKVSTKIREVGQSIVNTFKKFFGINSPSTVFAGFGKNLLEGLWNGISNLREWLIGKIKGLGLSITNGIKEVFGIHSPSTVFEKEVGENMALGLGNGFVNMMQAVSQRMHAAVPTDFDVNANINTSATRPASAGTTASGNSVLGNIVINIQSFVNNRTEDVQELAEELSVMVATELRRKGVAFG